MKKEHTPGPAKNFYKGWRIYFPSSGSNHGLKSVKAKHPLSLLRLEIVMPDRGMNKQTAIRLIKAEINKQPEVTATLTTTRP